MLDHSLSELNFAEYFGKEVVLRCRTLLLDDLFHPVFEISLLFLDLNAEVLLPKLERVRERRPQIRVMNRVLSTVHRRLRGINLSWLSTGYFNISSL